ncbi:hypothetical protein QMK19_39100 [Streptomyces sp. H10-C2]|uniref:hypothetical protein n=1 Tax=unclassified Streptomyces TaxID=2593676 RepID=UPI0024BAFBD1|nr:MULTISPECIES: hypothetical protein [unclassified Streptomyces]MDJ0347207.1 hypothetical protein [Streptomyces sp. PH10-H1]MDJ0375444.1 hypothetical protein [Streptomyces sp. H10-C2]
MPDRESVDHPLPICGMGVRARAESLAAPVVVDECRGVETAGDGVEGGFEGLEAVAETLPGGRFFCHARVMIALRVTWRMSSVVEDDLVTLYWFSEVIDPDAKRALGGYQYLRADRLDLLATAEERVDWTAAANICAGELAAAVAELIPLERRAVRWRRRRVGRRWADARLDDAAVSFRTRIRPAISAYRPVREAVEARLAEAEARQRRTREQAAQKQQERERQWLEHSARLGEWDARQALADRPLLGGLSPRRLAERGEDPTSWPADVHATVGDVAVWWAGVRASVRNERARADATQRVVEAVSAAAVALEAAGRPGIGIAAIQDRPTEKTLDGWWIEFDWAPLPGIIRPQIPPDRPLFPGESVDWHYRSHQPRFRLFTVDGRGCYGLAYETTNLRGGYGSVEEWRVEDIDLFARNLFPVWIFDKPSYSEGRYPVRLPVVDHADPAVFVPCVDAVAQRAVEHFQALAERASATTG